MLTRLQVENFKSWRKIDNMRLAPITGLFGTNSSGKSSILHLLLMLKQTVQSTDRAAVFEFGNERNPVALGGFGDVVFGHDTSLPLSLRVDWEREKPLEIKDPQGTKLLFFGDDLSFSTKVSEKGDGRLAVDELAYGLSGNTFGMRRKDQGSESKSWHKLSCDAGDFEFARNASPPQVLHPVKCYGFPDRLYAGYHNAGFLSELQLAFEELLGNVYYLGPLRDPPKRHYTWAGSGPADMGRRGERVVDAILASRQKGGYISVGDKERCKTLEERIAYWLKELGLIESFRIETIAPGDDFYRVQVKVSPDSTEVVIPDVGFGVSQVLPVLVLCYHVPEGSTILLEQPEIHLHPSVQSGLADVFIDVAQNRGVQIILESHSEHLLRRLQRRIAEEDVARDDMALYFCKAGARGSILTPLELDEFGNVANWPEGFFGDEFGELAAMTKAAMERKASGE